MSTNPLKTIVFISIGGFSLLSGILLTRTHTQTSPQADPLSQSIATQRQTPRHTLQSRHTRTQDSQTPFQTSDFYRTIVDKNLFRPLGWTPPRPREPYRLIGTLIPTEGSTEAEAILERTTGRTDSVTIGDKLDKDTTLIDILPKQVTLEKDGQQRTLRLNTTQLLK